MKKRRQRLIRREMVTENARLADVGDTVLVEVLGEVEIGTIKELTDTIFIVDLDDDNTVQTEKVVQVSDLDEETVAATIAGVNWL